ncbi:CDP-glycerol glycerophosphotransferase [Motilibacter peucedani]|uniref:CDP-glycerol glycerophosphotransferase n=1 Tax=Motilibacter peucedani TaxID=598650 RepID=A0A420XNP6_9ACTN|nr:CDP-glycerol glycerophosphotransferase family protein [Motilibacter peucedani]RKS73821.1 CDP-glycerol glycerophosphotransferase [Motilibacter peucedani]
MQIVWNSFGGRYSDNPRALYEALLAHPGAAGFRHTWLSDPLHAGGFPEGTPQVAHGSPESVAALESADLVVSNTHIELDWTKAPRARYLQTWHGTPLKHIHFDVYWAPEGRLDELTRDVRRWDVLLSPNVASTENLRNAFDFHGPVLETGYPRNDVLVDERGAEVRERVRAQLGIAPGTTAVLYTPTWRDDLLDGEGRLDFSLHLDAEEFSRRLGDDHVLLLRMHYMLSARLRDEQRPGVVDVSYHPDINELYLAADVLITDYSSTMFDFAVTGRPILCFTYDLEDYRDRLRGFYFDFAAIAPGPLLRTSDEVLGALEGLDAVVAEHADAYAAFRERFSHLEDGRASERVLEAVVLPLARELEAAAGLPALPAAAAHDVQVVVLAAGLGSRLGRPHPKPLTVLKDGRSILQQQVENLREVLGRDTSITAVVGFMAEDVMAAGPQLSFVYNADFATTNTSKSLLRALRGSRAGGVLWLNGDVVFDPRIVQHVLPLVEKDVSFVCVNTERVADEEVKYTLDDDGYVAELSKAVAGGLGEAIGINYVSSDDKHLLVERLEQCGPQDYFERGIELAVELDGLRVLAVDISQFPAVEVDFEEDLRRADAVEWVPWERPGS